MQESFQEFHTTIDLHRGKSNIRNKNVKIKSHSDWG